MRMSFWWGSDVGDYIFKGFTINNTATLVCICIGLTALGIVYEAMKVLKTKLRQKAAREATLPGLPVGRCHSVIEPPPAPVYNRCWPAGMSCSNALGDLLFYIMDSCVSYFIMLTVMLYNGPMFLAVIIGTAIGYFIFGHLSRKINMENVQAKTTTVLCVSTCPESSTPAITSSPSTSSTSPIMRNEEDVASDDLIHCERL